MILRSHIAAVIVVFITFSATAGAPYYSKAKHQVGINSVQLGYLTWKHDYLYNSWLSQPFLGLQYTYNQSDNFAFRTGINFSQNEVSYEGMMVGPFSKLIIKQEGYSVNVGIEKHRLFSASSAYLFADYFHFEGNLINQFTTHNSSGVDDKFSEQKLYQYGLTFGSGIHVKLISQMSLRIECNARLFRETIVGMEDYRTPILVSIHPISRISINYSF